jgi:hypothetical protein
MSWKRMEIIFGQQNSPPQPRRGGCAMKKMLRSHLNGADGVVLVKKSSGGLNEPP